MPEGQSLFSLRDALHPRADVVVHNGAPAAQDAVLQEEELEGLMAARHTPGVHRKVKAACIGIAGLGGLGSTVAIALARIGIGRLILADYDVVEPSNLNRQQYFVDQLGMPKTEALAENLARINPYVALDCHPVRLTPENVAVIYNDAHILVEAFDRADQKAMLTIAFVTAFPGRPIITAAGLAGHMPGNTIRTKKRAAQIYVVGDGETAARPGTGLMAPRVGIAAHHQANAVLRLVLGEEPE